MCPVESTCQLKSSFRAQQKLYKHGFLLILAPNKMSIFVLGIKFVYIVMMVLIYDHVSSSKFACTTYMV